MKLRTYYIILIVILLVFTLILYIDFYNQKREFDLICQFCGYNEYTDADTFYNDEFSVKIECDNKHVIKKTYYVNEVNKWGREEKVRKERVWC